MRKFLGTDTGEGLCYKCLSREGSPTLQVCILRRISDSMGRVYSTGVNTKKDLRDGKKTTARVKGRLNTEVIQAMNPAAV